MRKKVLIFIGITLFSAEIFSQDSNSQETSHRAENGNLYWKKSVPIYLFISDNSEGSNFKKLDSKRSADYVNPMYLDSEGLNYIRSRWATDSNGKTIDPREEVKYEIYADGVEPKSHEILSHGQEYAIENRQYFGKDLKLDFVAEDATAGIKTIWYKINNSEFKAFDQSIFFSEEKEYIVEYYAEDNVSNAEKVKSLVFVVDITVPMTKISIVGDKYNNILSANTAVKFVAIDQASGLKETFYTIDDGLEKAVNDRPAVGLGNLVNGKHIIKFYSIDNVGNQEPVRTYEFITDNKAPKVEASIIGDQYQNRGRVFVSNRSKIKIDVEDDWSGVKQVHYRIGSSSELQLYTEPFDLPQKEGEYDIVFVAEDNVNNKSELYFNEEVNGRQSLNIDVKAPTLSYEVEGKFHNLTPNIIFATKESRLKILAEDEHTNVKKIGYKVNQGQGKPYSDYISFSTDGVHLVDYYAVDEVNNRNQQTVKVIIDNVAPEINFIFSAKPFQKNEEEQHLVYPKGTQLYLGAIDSLSGTENILFSLNGAVEEIYARPIIISKSGSNTLKVWATDKLGNVSKEKVQEILIR